MDKFSTLRDRLQMVAAERDEWAGFPMPLEGERLIIEPSYPYAEAMSAINAEKPNPEDTGWRVRNTFWSTRHRCDVVVMQEADGSISRAYLHRRSLDLEMRTMACSEAWGIEQEQRALQLLGTMLNHLMFKRYLLTGMFMETSKRSGVTYIFRRLRPTVALRANLGKGVVKILCALCQHPVGLYADSFAGAMCGTDDVIAHLALMRGDEKMFWKRSSQHAPSRPEAGL